MYVCTHTYIYIYMHIYIQYMHIFMSLCTYMHILPLAKVGTTGGCGVRGGWRDTGWKEMGLGDFTMPHGDKWHEMEGKAIFGAKICLTPTGADSACIADL